MLLLHSDTPEGRFCSDRLRRFYTDFVKCRRVEARPLTALGYAGASFFPKWANPDISPERMGPPIRSICRRIKQLHDLRKENPT